MVMAEAEPPRGRAPPAPHRAARVERGGVVLRERDDGVTSEWWVRRPIILR